ncbi:MAG: VOC family protein [Bryobacterales bacterium]|nr:VOC family protein [Bryobacterales bacterium]
MLLHNSVQHGGSQLAQSGAAGGGLISTDTTLSVAPLHTANMQIQQLQDLGIVTAQLTESQNFYTTRLGFQPVFVSDWYVHLKNGPVEFGLMAATPESPAAPATAVWLSLGVANADAEHARLTAAGVPVEGEPQDHPWGVRSFVVRDPNGLGVSIGHTIPMNDEFMRAHNKLTHASS